MSQKTQQKPGETNPGQSKPGQSKPGQNEVSKIKTAIDSEVKQK